MHFPRVTSAGRRTAVSLAVIAAVVLAACSGDDDASDTTEPAVTTATTAATETTAAPETTVAPDTAAAPATTEPTGDFDPYAQTLEWTACDLGECAEVTVPIDYDDSSAGTTTIAMIRQTAAGDPADRVGTLFVNPGGPGESGIDFVLDAGFFFGQPILESFDIVGFDPRGVGASDPLICLDDDELDTWIAADIDADDPASVEAYGELTAGMAEACLETNPELSQHVTTVETAKDIDVLRALVGDDELYYFGGSYGTFLGATYAALFPDHVGRMVLDGAMDPSIALLQNDLRQAGGFQLAFDDYATDCVANACPLGETTDEIEGVVAGVFEAALAEPLPTDDADRPLTRSLAFYGVIAELYAEEQWPLLTEAISAAADGDGTLLLAFADTYFQRTEEGYGTNTAESNKAITCLDAALAPEADSLPTEDDFIAASSLFGEIYYGLVEIECDTWPIEPSVGFPDYSAPGAAPILVVGSTGDPATPIESAYVLADQLESGVLLVREGEGHTAYFNFNPCINEIVDAYLAEGTVPEDETTCSEDGEIVDADDSGDAEATTTTTAPDDGDDDGESALGSDADGTVVLTVAGDIVFEGEVTECTIADPDVQLLAQGETAELQLISAGGGTTAVAVSGAYEFAGNGTPTFDPATAGLDQGDLTIDGTGSQPDDGAPVADFTVEVSVVSC